MYTWPLYVVIYDLCAIFMPFGIDHYAYIKNRNKNVNDIHLLR